MPVTQYAIASVDYTTDTITTVANPHNLVAGTAVFVKAEAGGSLPGGLATLSGEGGISSRLYYVRSPGTNTLQLSAPMNTDGTEGALMNLSSNGSGTLTLQLAEGVPFVPIEPVYASGECEISNVPLRQLLIVDGLVPGSMVRIARDDTGEVLFKESENAGQIQFLTDYKSLLRIEARKSDSTPFYRVWYGAVTLTDKPLTMTAVQEMEE